MKLPAILLLAVACVSVNPAFGQSNPEDPEDLYERLFGEESRQVTATPSKSDDVAFARTLLNSAKAVPASPDLQRLLFDRAFELARADASGEGVAIEALQSLAAAQPSQRQHAWERLVPILERRLRSSPKSARRQVAGQLVPILQELGDAAAEAGRVDEAIAAYRRALPISAELNDGSGDELARRISALTARERAAKRLEEARVNAVETRKKLESALDSGSGDGTTAVRLAKLLLAEFDDPAAAQVVAERVDSPQLKRAIELAAAKSEELSEQQSLELAELYLEMAAEVSDLGKLTVLRHASNLFALVLARHATADATRLQASRGLDKAGRLLAGLDPVLKTEEFESTSKFFGVEAKGSRVAFICDASGSMRGEKFECLKRELRKSLLGMPDRMSYFICFYSSEVMPLGGQVKWTEANSQGRGWGSARIQDVQAQGGTVPDTAFELAFGMMPRPDVVFFLTDGLFDPNVAEQVAWLNRGHKKIPVHCLTLVDSAAEQIMRDIAKRSGGTYTHIPATLKE